MPHDHRPFGRGFPASVKTADNERFMPFLVRPAIPRDAGAMARILNDIIVIGGTTSHKKPFDPRDIVDLFISPPLKISCYVATDDAELLGFQALEWCDPDWPGEDPLPADWAVVATYVDPDAHRRGVGRGMFAKTVEAAKTAGVRFIDATIQRKNIGGQAYYQGVGFTDYRETENTVSKRIALV